MLLDGGHAGVIDQQLAVNGKRWGAHSTSEHGGSVEQRIEFLHARGIGIDKILVERDARRSQSLALFNAIAAGGQRIHHHAIARRELTGDIGFSHVGREQKARAVVKRTDNNKVFEQSTYLRNFAVLSLQTTSLRQQRYFTVSISVT